MDKAFFEKTQWYRSLSPEAKMAFLQEAMREMTQERPWNMETPGSEFIKALIALIFTLFGVDVEEEEKREESAQKAA